MKRTLFIMCFICIHGAGYAQEDQIDSTVKNRFRTIVDLMLSGNAEELSKYVAYPLWRENPLPNIENRQQFIEQFPILIDSAFKEKLKRYSDKEIFEHNGGFGLVGKIFRGDLWITDDSAMLLTSLNYSSASEQAIRKSLIARQKEAMYPSVRNWDANIVVARTKKLLIRLDRIDTTVRYAAWSNGRSQSEKPDIVIQNGFEEAQGSAGGITWTFKNRGYTYVVDDVQLGQDPEDEGYFLYVSKGKKVLSHSRLELIK